MATVKQAPNMWGIAPDIAAQQADLQRRQQLVDMLRKENDKNTLETQYVSGAGPTRAVPISNFQGLAKLLETGLGAYEQHKINSESNDLAKRTAEAQNEQFEKQWGKSAPSGQSPVANTYSAPDGTLIGDTGSQSVPMTAQQTPKDDVYSDLKRAAYAEYLRGNMEGYNKLLGNRFEVTNDQKNMNAMGQDPLQMGKLATAKARKEGIIELQPGTTALDLSNGQERFQPKVGEGISLNNGQASVLPGYAQANASIEGAKSSAQEGAKLLPIGYVGQDNAPIGGTVAQYLGGNQDSQSKQNPDFAPKGLIDANVKMANSIQDPEERQSFINARISQVYNQKGLSSQQKDQAVQLFQSALQSQGSNKNPQESQTSALPKLQSSEQKAFGEEVATGSGKDLLKGRDQAKGAADDLYSINESRKAIKSGAFLGAGADLKTDLAKGIKSLVGIDIDPNKVSNSEYLRSTLGQRMLDNAKKLGINPTDADAKRLDAIIGTISKDPTALSQALDFQEEMAHRAINKHNSNVSDAEKRGLRSPFNLSIEIPKFEPIPENSIGTVNTPKGTPVDYASRYGIKTK